MITGDQPFSKIPLFLAGADVLVSPRVECPGIPQKLSNYMAAGKPIVSFEGSAKLLKHPTSGAVMENGNINEMANWIVTLLNNVEMGRLMGLTAKNSLVGRFDWDSLAKNVESVYYSLLKEN
jgi:glycosyltransferase involved in cell wall biosynthesis